MRPRVVVPQHVLPFYRHEGAPSPPPVGLGGQQDSGFSYAEAQLAGYREETILEPSIREVAVIGAGTMGAGIAALLANAGLSVRLLDVVPTEVSDDERAKGLTLEHPAVRSRLARAAIERLRSSRPPALFAQEVSNRIAVGNLDDHAAWLGGVDWIIEAVVERLDVKRALLTRIDALRRPDAIVSTNTSGLPVTGIAEGASDSLQAQFLGTHFFNPPRYMKLVELVPGARTSPAVVATMRRVLAHRLGKGVAVCKDTPNFIGNRFGAIAGAQVLSFALEHGYTVEEVDAITGPLLGRPKTATFRLLDLVGIDVWVYVNENLHALIPHDESRDSLKDWRAVRLLNSLVESGRLGEKSGSGFYQRLPKAKGGDILTLDLETLDYRPRREPSIPSVTAAAKMPSLIDRWRHLLAADDKGGALAREMRRAIAYMSHRIPEVCDDYPTIDRVVRWGFNHERGPFELWDDLGFADLTAQMERDGMPVASWAHELLRDGHTRLYQVVDTRLQAIDLGARRMVSEVDEGHILVGRLRQGGRAVKTSKGASLVDLGDDVLALEIHSKLNTLDADVTAMMFEARAALDGRWAGLVVGNDATDFSVGANLKMLLGAAEAGGANEIERVVKSVQDAMQALRTAPKPVVAAPVGRALGGGCELVLAASRAVAGAELYAGLVEIGVGLLPAAGGCKEFVRRHVSVGASLPNADPLPHLQRVLQTLGLARVSGSALEAQHLGYLAASDPIVMNRDELIARAKTEVLAMSAAGYVPATTKGNCFAAGRNACATLRTGLFLMEQAGHATAHDRHVADRIAWVICGGDVSVPQWVDEQYLLDLEREAFVSLTSEPKTIERIQHMLTTGKPLRN